MVVVVVTTAMADLPAAIVPRAGVTVQEGAAPQVLVKVSTQPDAGTPVEPIVTIPAEFVPATEGDVPQFDEHEGVPLTSMVIPLVPALLGDLENAISRGHGKSQPSNPAHC
jgi:hypothetical protein